jgi:molybdopterin synthase sulfur carrier subunit
MTTSITIPTALRQYAGGNASVSLEADTVGGLLRGLVELHPQLGKHLFNEDGKLRSYVNVYLGDEDIRYLDGEDTVLTPGETVSIIPAIAGGRDVIVADTGGDRSRCIAKRLFYGKLHFLMKKSHATRAT